MKFLVNNTLVAILPEISGGTEYDNLICGERYGKTTVFPDVVIIKINGDDI